MENSSSGAAARKRGAAAGDDATRDLAVVLNDIAWLLPRTLGRVSLPDDVLPASELEVMRLLVRHPGLSVNEVGAELAMRPSNVSGTVRTLIAQGLLERRRDEGDGRVARLHPTDRAIANRDRREAAWGEALERYLGSLGASERRRILATSDPLRQLVEVLGGGATEGSHSA
ncbi:MAG: winged helix-turn-helix transcriptional regulator [Actinobacteria bacterium]|nr:winged helix-turn-helix transcriptional regulator [Actinomycetota bacterium]